MSRKLIVGLLGVGSVGLLVIGFFLYLKVDRTPPEIMMPEEMISYSDGEDEAILLENVTAYDDVDLDVTSSLIVESVIPMNDNEHAKVIYAAKDSSNNITKETRTVLYNVLKEQRGEASTGDDIDHAVAAASETDPKETQEETQEPLVSSGSAPVIRLNTYKVTQPVGSEFDFMSYIDDIVDDVDERSTLFTRIRLDGEYNIHAAGTYVLEYYVLDSDMNESNRERFTLVVQ